MLVQPTYLSGPREQERAEESGRERERAGESGREKEREGEREMKLKADLRAAKNKYRTSGLAFNTSR